MDLMNIGGLVGANIAKAVTHTTDVENENHCHIPRLCSQARIDVTLSDTACKSHEVLFSEHPAR